MPQNLMSWQSIFLKMAKYKKDLHFIFVFQRNY